MTVVFVGEGGAQNGRMAECLNAAAKENLPILFLVIDNGGGGGASSTLA